MFDSSYTVKHYDYDCNDFRAHAIRVSKNNRDIASIVMNIPTCSIRTLQGRGNPKERQENANKILEMGEKFLKEKGCNCVYAEPYMSQPPWITVETEEFYSQNGYKPQRLLKDFFMKSKILKK